MLFKQCELIIGMLVTSCPQFPLGRKERILVAERLIVEIKALKQEETRTNVIEISSYLFLDGLKQGSQERSFFRIKWKEKDVKCGICDLWMQGSAFSAGAILWPMGHLALSGTPGLWQLGKSMSHKWAEAPGMQTSQGWDILPQKLSGPNVNRV